jgi:hypothetical protein
MIVYRIFRKNCDPKKGEFIGALVERRRDLRGKTRVETGLRWAKLTFGQLIKDKHAIFVVPKELNSWIDARWLVEKAFTKEELRGMVNSVEV